MSQLILSIETPTLVGGIATRCLYPENKHLNQRTETTIIYNLSFQLQLHVIYIAITTK